MKIIKKIVARVQGFFDTISRFLLTTIFLVLAAIINSINISQESINELGKYVLILFVGAFFAIVAQVVYEKYFSGIIKRILSMAIALALTAAYYFAFIHNQDMNTIMIVRASIVLFALLIAFIWIPIIKTKFNFNESFLVAFKSLFIAVFFASVLFGGVSLIIAAIDNLLFAVDEKAYMQSTSIIYILFASLYFLSLIPSYNKNDQTKEENEHIEKMISCGKFLEILISYILIPLASVFTLILLIYIIINFTDEFWRNSLLEPMLVSYSIVVIVLYILSSTLGNKLVKLFRMIFPKVLIPIVLFQTIASVLKVGDNGLPFTRYYVILYGLFALTSGIIFSIISIKKNGLIAPILIGLLIISIIPPIDAFSTGKRTQINMLEKVLEENSMLINEEVVPNPDINESDMQKITQAVEYIFSMGYDNEVSFLKDDFNMYEDFKVVFGFDPYYYHDIEDEYRYGGGNLDERIAIDVSGYDYMILSYLNISDREDNADTEPNSIEIDGNTYTVTYANGQENGIVYVLDENSNSIISLDILDSIQKLYESFDYNNMYENYLTLEEATTTVENESAKLEAIIQSFWYEVDDQEEMFFASFYLLISIK